jgi:hypothetical protein
VIRTYPATQFERFSTMPVKSVKGQLPSNSDQEPSAASRRKRPFAVSALNRKV